MFGSTMDRAADILVGGWELGSIYSFESGQPFTVSCPVATTADFGCFANLTGQGLYSGGHQITQWLNPNTQPQSVWFSLVPATTAYRPTARAAAATGS